MEIPVEVLGQLGRRVSPENRESLTNKLITHTHTYILVFFSHPLINISVAFLIIEIFIIFSTRILCSQYAEVEPKLSYM